MDRNNCKERDSLRDDRSQRNFQIDKIKSRGRFFGDVTYDSLENVNQRNDSEKRKNINDRLNDERTKALEALKRSRKIDAFRKPHPVNNSKSAINISSNNQSLQLDNSGYVPFRRPSAINISDLVTDETINLESSSSRVQSLSKDVKVSFEPSEITGRSTLYDISVNDILASSFAPKARNLCDTLLDHDSSERHQRHGMPSSSISSTSFNGSRSLPRTADMSLSKHTCTEESFNGGFDISFKSAPAGFSESENFAPGELMKSRLVNDEISWAQEYAPIPAAALSKEAKAKAFKNSGLTSNCFDSPSSSNSMVAGDANFSVGSFFNKRSENIWNIVKSKSPEKCGSPIALVDEDDNTVTTTTTDVTPKIDNKTYTLLETITRQLENDKTPLPRASSAKLNYASKDSGNSPDTSYILSISAIDRALCNLDIQSNVSGIGVSEQLLKQGKQSKSCKNNELESDISKSKAALMCSKERSLASDMKVKSVEKKIADEMILENKENLDPKKRTSRAADALCDTLSFSETLLNSSDMKNLNRSSAQTRSPLSPINVVAPAIRLNQDSDVGEEADNDEWPSTPITNNKRVRRKKSPRDKSPLHDYSPKGDSNDSKNPVNTSRSSINILNNKNKSDKETKSMSSTRLDGEDRNSGAVCDFQVSPNMSNSQHHASSLMVRSNTLCVPQIGNVQPASPNRLDVSPISSPSRYQLSQVTSPTPTSIEYRSPNLDATSNSDRQLLNAGAARKILSSPGGSESSSTCSYATIQSSRSGISGRSVSRCSSSSEFSHRDGKQIPIKVTHTELSWRSTKLRTKTLESMQVKNIIKKRLVFRFEVSGPGFQIERPAGCNTLTLHSLECRGIVISFCPTVCGVAIGKLSFYAPFGPKTPTNSFLDVPLYAYGGNASIIAQNVSLDPLGRRFLTMGYVFELTQPLERTISFYNKGPLVGFAIVAVDPMRTTMPRLSDVFDIQPSSFLIHPRTVVNVRIVFRPKREEIRKLIKKMGVVRNIGTVTVICGEEALRQRIGRLLSQMGESERCNLISSSVYGMWSSFPQEIEIPDLDSIKESPSAASHLASSCRIYEIELTINRDNLDDTFESSVFFEDADETILFRTIYAASDSPTPTSNLGRIDEYEEFSPQCGSKFIKHYSWSVSPQKLDINLNNPEPVTLRVCNRFKSRQFFEVVCNLKDIFQFTPSDGYVAADGGQTDINITLNTNFQCPSESVFIKVYMENERITVPVNIIQ